jgi:hypothetical protein
MCGALNAAQFLQYAQQQAIAAEAILARHTAMAYGQCRCGRTTPCPVAALHARRRDYFRTRLAIMRHAMTQPGPDGFPPGDFWHAATAANLDATSRQFAHFFRYHGTYPLWRQF